MLLKLDFILDFIFIHLLLRWDVEITRYEPQVLAASTFKGGTFFNDPVLQCLSLVHSFAK